MGKDVANENSCLDQIVAVIIVFAGTMAEPLGHSSLEKDVVGCFKSHVVGCETGKPVCLSPNQVHYGLLDSGFIELVQGARRAEMRVGDLFVVSSRSHPGTALIARSQSVLRLISILPEHLHPLFAETEFSCLAAMLGVAKAGKIHRAGSPPALRARVFLSKLDGVLNMSERAELLALVGNSLGIQGNPGAAHQEKRAELLNSLPGLTADDIMNLPVNELAAKYHVSRRHLSRIFQEHFGIAIATVKMEMRLIHAARLLQNPELKVIEAAERSGFNHLGLFNTCFKRKFGVSPTQFRSHAKSRRSFGAGLNDCAMRKAGLCSWSGPQASDQAFPDEGSQAAGSSA